MMYKEKYLKYKNKYLELKKSYQKGGSSSASATAGGPNDYESILDDLINSDNILSLVEKLNNMIQNSLESHKDIPVSDKILIKLFGIERIENLYLLQNYLNTIYEQHNIIKQNPESILSTSPKNLSNIKNYNIYLSKLHDMIRFNSDDESIIKHLKCLIVSIKQIKNIDRQSLTSQKKEIEIKRNALIESYRLFSTFNKKDIDECMSTTKVYTQPKVTQQTLSAKTFKDDIMGATYNISEPNFIFNTNKDGGKFRIIKDQSFLPTITELVTHREYTSLLIEPKPKNYRTVHDDIKPGCIITNHFKISLIIKWKIDFAENCLIHSDDFDIFKFITKNKVSRINKSSDYNFVEDVIIKRPFILLDDEYRYDFDERLELDTFKFYKKINQRIYALLQDTNKEPNEIGSLLCLNCKMYTTSKKTDIMCSKCHETYCRICSNKVHPFIECFAKTDPKDVEHIDETYTSCPECKAPIERSSKCIHMTCTQCETQFCHLCGERWDPNPESLFEHIWNGLCPEAVKYPKIIEYIPILTNLSPIINISKSQIRILQKYPKLLQYLIDTKQSIMVLGDTPEKLQGLKEDPRFSNSPEKLQALKEKPRFSDAGGGSGI
jgi:hypothetical protein